MFALLLVVLVVAAAASSSSSGEGAGEPQRTDDEPQRTTVFDFGVLNPMIFDGPQPVDPDTKDKIGGTVDTGGTPRVTTAWNTTLVPYDGKYKMSVDPEDAPPKELQIPLLPDFDLGIPDPIAKGLTAIATHLNNVFRETLRSLSGNVATSYAGRFETVASRQGRGAYAEVVITWGRRNEDGTHRLACGRIAFAGERADSGQLPFKWRQSLPMMTEDGKKPTVGLDSNDELAYCRNGQRKVLYGHWLMPAGPPEPAAYLGVEGNTTDLVVWLPGRGERMWYRVEWRWTSL